MGKNANLYRHGTVFAPKQFDDKRKLWERRAQKYNPCMGSNNPQTCEDLENTRFHAVPYKGKNANLRNFGAPYRHDTVFAPKQFACQKEAMGKESPKI